MNKKCARDRNAMVKKVSLNISDDNYKELSSLSDFYNQDVEDVIISILDAVGMGASRIINLSKEYKVPVNLVSVIRQILDASICSLSNEVLEKLEVKGLCRLEDFDIDIDLKHMWFYYSVLTDKLQIDTFHLEIHPGLKYLDTKSYIDVEKVDSKALDKLYDLVESVEVPEEFGLLEDYLIPAKIKINEEDEELWNLEVDCVAAASLNYLPSLKRISEFVEQIFKKVGI